MKTSRRELAQRFVLVILVVVVFGFASFAVRSVHHPSESQAEGCAADARDQHEDPESLWSPATWRPDTSFACLLFFATAGLWVFTALLWSTTSRAVSDGKEAIGAALRAANAADRHATVAEQTLANTRELAAATSRSAEAASISAAALAASVALMPKFERAYISIGSHNHHMTGTSISFAMEFVNFGKTPGIVIGVWFINTGNIFPISMDYSICKGYEVRSVCSTSQSIKSGIIIEGTAPIFYVFGYFTYKDIFGDLHKTYFCQQWDIAQGYWNMRVAGGDTYNRTE